MGRKFFKENSRDNLQLGCPPRPKGRMDTNDLVVLYRPIPLAAQKTEAFLNGVDKDKLLLLDYYAENTEVWRKTNSYYNHKFIWCYLGNFGGNTMLVGNFKETSRRIENALKETHGLMNGIGSTLEGLDCNPLMYEFVLDKA